MSGQLPLKLRLDSRAQLNDYVGDVADRLVALSGVILLSGEKGSGKSHLLQACCHEAQNAGRSAVYLSSLADLVPEILNGLESANLVCLDDIDLVLADRQWQLAMFQLINAIKDAGGSLILSSTATVAELPATLLPDLSSRLLGAYLIATPRLDDEQKLEVIRRRAKSRGFEMSEEVCRFILGRASRDMHHLTALVEQLDVETLRRQKKVTIPFVKEALGL